MTAIPNSGDLSNNANTQLQEKGFMEALRDFVSEMPGGGTEQALTLSGDTIVPAVRAGRIIVIDTEAGAATDNFSTVTTTNLPDGAMLWIRSTSTGRVPTVKNGTGNILTADGADFALTDPSMFICFARRGSSIVELNRFYGNQKAAQRTFLGLGTAALSPTGTTTGASPANIPTVDQADARYAKLAGLSTQVFSAADPTSAQHAVTKNYAGLNYAALGGLNTQQFNAADPSAANHCVTKQYGDLHYGTGNRFTSTDQAISAGQTYALPHLLGAIIPRRLWFTLINVTTEGGWVTGDEVHPVMVLDSASNTAEGVMLWADTTNVNAVLGGSATFLRVLNKTTGGITAVTAAKWKIRFYAEP